MPITTEEALALNQGDVITDGTAEFAVTNVTDLGGGKFRVDLTHEVVGDSYFTHDHLHVVTKVESESTTVPPAEPDADELPVDDNSADALPTRRGRNR